MKRFERHETFAGESTLKTVTIKQTRQRERETHVKRAWRRQCQGKQYWRRRLTGPVETWPKLTEHSTLRGGGESNNLVAGWLSSPQFLCSCVSVADRLCYSPDVSYTHVLLNFIFFICKYIHASVRACVHLPIYIVGFQISPTAVVSYSIRPLRCELVYGILEIHSLRMVMSAHINKWNTRNQVS